MLSLKYHGKIVAFLFTIAFTMSSVNAFAQQKATIKGRIINVKNQGVRGINIGLQGTNLGAASGKQGYFTIEGVPAGHYTFVVTGVGFKTVRKPINLKDNQTLSIIIHLSRNNLQLEQIVVRGENSQNRYTVERSTYVAKIPLNKMENPQMYNTITSDLLEDQDIVSFEGALKNAPGVTKLWSSTGRGVDGAGYYSLRGFAIQPQMINGLPSLTNGPLDPANINRIEIIKGPSATLFGSTETSYGGLINVVTKKPYDTTGGKVSYHTGSFGLNRITADYNTPFGLNDNFALRVVSAFTKKNSFQNSGFNQSFFLAPSLRYQNSDKLSFLFNAAFYRPESTNPLMLFLNRSAPLVAHNIRELGYDNDLSYTTNDLTIKNPTLSVQAQMNYRISDHWHSQTVISRSSTESNGYYSYVSTIGIPDNMYGRYISDQNSTLNGTDIQENLRGHFNIGGVTNRLLVGVDFFQKTLVNNNTGYITYDKISLNNFSPPAISKAVVDTMLASAPVTQNKTQQQVYSIYASDVIEIIPRLSAMISLRLDHYVSEGSLKNNDDDYYQTALSPKFGLVFQPIKDRLSLFANYMNGFSNVGPVTQGDGTVKNFGPERANQWETGAKVNFFNGKLNAAASYYDITVSNILRLDPNRPNFTIQDGKNYSHGVEFSVTASPIRGLHLIAGYSHNNSKVVKTSNDAIRGRRPERAGPIDMANAWISYRFTSGAIKGLTFGFGGNYASDNYVINRSTTGIFTIPAYTVLNASVSYETDSYRLALKLNNFMNEEYYTGWSTVSPQAPRNIVLGFSYKF